MMVTVAPEGPSRSVSTATCRVAASPVLRVTCLKGAEEITAIRDTPASGAESRVHAPSTPVIAKRESRSLIDVGLRKDRNVHRMI